MQEKDFNQTGAAVFPLTAAEAGDLAAIVERIGADPRSLRYLGPKRRVLHFFVPKVDYRAAAFVKQELLARGGDAIVARHVIDGRTELSDILMMGTDGQLAASDAVVLQDDRGFFPSYRCGNVVREEVLTAHPELADTLEKLTDTITDAEMARMNYAVESAGREPRAVAEEHLRSKGLLR